MHATQILHWQENLLGDDMPPEWMWSFDDELDTWFKEVKARRSTPSSSDDEEVPMMSNTLVGRR